MGNMRIKFGDLQVSPEARKHLEDCVDTHIISGGPKVKLLEEEWGKLFGYKYSLAVSNGTDADMAACMTLYELEKDVVPGDEIIAPALAFISVGNSIRAAGFKPVFVDVERETLNINPDLIEERISDRTRAIMAVHTMGKPCDMEKILGIAERHDLRVLEDCCEAHGAKYGGDFVGAFGDMSAFSFYVAHIVTCGDGGIISTNDGEVYDILRSVKDHGRTLGSLFFDHPRFGFNFRMNALTASIGIPEIEKFWITFNQRKDNLTYLTEQTRDLSDLAFFVEEEDYETVSPHAFSLTLKDPKLDYGRFYDFLELKGIECKRNFGSMPTQQDAFRYLGHSLGEFPEAEYVGNNGLHFGIHQYLSREDLDYASEVLHEYFEKHA